MASPHPPGFSHHPHYFGPSEQAALVAEVCAALDAAPLFQPRMPRTGTPTSVLMSNLGSLGWVSDKERGYRYQPTHPETGAPWPALPEALVRLWRDVTDWPDLPECCLVNWYAPHRNARMGAHVDADEDAVNAPIVSVSIGDPAMYRLGGLERGGKTTGIKLHSGDVVVMAGEARRRYHAVSRIWWGESALLPESHFPGGGRLNLTLRRVRG